MDMSRAPRWLPDQWKGSLVTDTDVSTVAALAEAICAEINHADLPHSMVAYVRDIYRFGYAVAYAVYYGYVVPRGITLDGMDALEEVAEYLHIHQRVSRAERALAPERVML